MRMGLSSSPKVTVTHARDCHLERGLGGEGRLLAEMMMKAAGRKRCSMYPDSL